MAEYKSKMINHMRFVVYGRPGGRPFVRIDDLCEELPSVAGHNEFADLIKRMAPENLSEVASAYMIDKSTDRVIAEYSAEGPEVIFRPENENLRMQLLVYLKSLKKKEAP